MLESGNKIRGEQVATRARQAAEAQGGRLPKREKNKLATRAKLLQAAYEVMSRVGVEAARIQDITDEADIGFGTFYNYFESKDDLARQVLDCMIDDIGRRNAQATAALRAENGALVIGSSMYLLMRVAIGDPIWRWWALRPDMLVERLRAVVGRYAAIDSAAASASGAVQVAHERFTSAWYVTTWVIAGGIHDIVTERQPPTHLEVVVGAAMQMLGVPLDVLQRLKEDRLPDYPGAQIDWTFRLPE